MACFMLIGATAFTPSTMHHPGLAWAHESRRAVRQPVAVATSEGNAVKEAAKKVTAAAKKFGVTQGKVAQLWVEEALRGGRASADNLMEIEMVLFDECRLEDGAKCTQLESGMEELLAAVEAKQSKPRAPVFAFQLGAEPIQAAATKVMAAARQFGPEQEEAADTWVKKVLGGELVRSPEAMTALLEEQIMLYGECMLSEDGTTSHCQELEEALTEFEAALSACDITSAKVGRVVPISKKDAQ
jgi:hypothetical protein